MRPAPALADLDGDGDLDVVVGDESGMLRALDGKTGKRLWAVATGGNDYGAKGFIGAAAVADLDGDGHPDVVAGARDGILSAYRGTDGGVLWQIANSSGIHASPIIADFDQDGHPEVLAAWSYGDVAIADGKTGDKRWATRLAQDSGGIEGLFGTPTPLPGAPGVLIAPTSWWGKEDGIIGVGVDERRFRSFEGRVSASAVVTDLANDGKLEAILGTEAGKLVALTADGGRAVLAKLGGPIEAPAMLADTDGDGDVRAPGRVQRRQADVLRDGVDGKAVHLPLPRREPAQHGGRRCDEAGLALAAAGHGRAGGVARRRIARRHPCRLPALLQGADGPGDARSDAAEQALPGGCVGVQLAGGAEYGSLEGAVFGPGGAARSGCAARVPVGSRLASRPAPRRSRPSRARGQPRLRTRGSFATRASRGGSASGAACAREDHYRRSACSVAGARASLIPGRIGTA